MKKTLLFLLAATAMMMAGCSNDDFGGATQGMTLNATVEQPASRATMTESNDGSYKFSFTDNDNDKLNVTNSKVESYYTFTKKGETFTSSDAQTTTAPADWYAYFPGNTVNLTKQNGDLAGVANYYACAGKTASATTGADGLTISLTPQVAILRIVKVDGNSTTCDINVKTGEKWVSGLKAKNNEAGFDVVTSDTKVTLLTASEPGTYYIAVPAGVKIAIYNGGTLVRATKDKGLTAGMYYTLTTGPVRGEASATGVTEKVGWVQLWAGGPKFATQNVAGTMKWTDAVKNKFWGDNWRVPTKDEMGLSANNTVNTEKVSAVYRCNENGVWGFEFTGITPGYTNVSLFLPANSGAVDNYGEATYWTATPVGSNQAGYQLSLVGGDNYVANCHYAAFGHDGDSYVRPVLVENDNPNTAQ